MIILNLYLGLMNKIMVYEGIMTPIEMFSNSNRLPDLTSPIYEPDLVASMILYSNNTSEYTEYLVSWLYKIYESSLNANDTPLFEAPQFDNLLTDPISVCQFHVIEVKIIS